MAKIKSGVRWIVPILAIAGFLSLAYYAKYGPPADVPRKDATKPFGFEGRSAAKPQNARTVLVPRAVERSGRVEWVTEPKEASAESDAVIVAVNAFLQTSGIAKDARLVSTRLDGDTISLHFERLTARGYGSDDESTLIKGILRAVKLNSSAKRAIFLEGEERLLSLGMIDLSEPQPVR